MALGRGLVGLWGEIGKVWMGIEGGGNWGGEDEREVRDFGREGLAMGGQCER